MMAAVNLFDAAALDVFFEDAGSMGLSNRTRLQPAHEGIADPEDFKEFDEDGLNAIFLRWIWWRLVMLLWRTMIPYLYKRTC